jgi:hypothetical protein
MIVIYKFWYIHTSDLWNFDPLDSGITLHLKTDIEISEKRLPQFSELKFVG